MRLGGRWETRGRTLTDADLTSFSGLAGDFNPLHVDERHAGAGHFGGRVAHASLISGIALGLGSMDVPLSATIGMVGMSWKFNLPVRPGDTVRTRWRLARKRAVANPRWGLAVWEVEVLDQKEEVVAQGEVARIVARRALEAAPGAGTDGGRRRRRRSSGGTAAPAPEVPPLPEPAPADVPAPSRRRRSRRGGQAAEAVTPEPAVPERTPPEGGRRRRARRGGGTGRPSPPASGEAPPPPGREADRVGAQSFPSAAQPEPEADTGQVRRRRRRRGGGGRTEGSPEAQAQGAAVAPAPAQPTLAADPPDAITKVLRRLRRPRSTPPGAGP